MNARSIRKLVIGLTLFPLVASAELGSSSRPLVPLPSVLDLSRGDGWGIAIGLAAEYESAYDGSDEYEAEIEPAGAIQYRSGNHLLFWEGIELGWRSRLSDPWMLQIGLRREPGRGSDESPKGYLNGLKEQDDELVGVLEARYALDSEWRNWIGARLMGANRDFGTLAVIAAGHRFGAQTDGTGTEVFAFSTFGSSKFINKDFGVTADEVLASRYPETNLKGGYRSSGLTVIDRRWITNNLQLLVQGGIELYSQDIYDSSPIARRKYETELGASLVYRF